VVTRTFQIQRGQEGHQLLGAALIHALTVGQCVQLVEHLEEPSGGLVDGADNSASTGGKHLQQMDALEAGGAVQARGGLVKEHYGRIADQLQGDREALLLASRQIASHRVAVLAQAESQQDVIDLEETAAC